MDHSLRWPTRLIFALARRSCLVMTEPMLDPNVGRAGICSSGGRGVATDGKHGSELRWRDHSLSRPTRVSQHRWRDSIDPARCQPLPWPGPGDGQLSFLDAVRILDWDYHRRVPHEPDR